MKDAAFLTTKGVGLVMVGLSIGLGLYAAFQPDYVNADGFLVEPFGYRVTAVMLALLGAGLLAISWLPHRP